MTNKLVFFGTEDFSRKFLKVLKDDGYDIACVVTKPDTPSGRGRTLASPAVKQLADELSLPVKQTLDAEHLSTLDATAGVLASYGKILPKDVLDIFPKGIINVHPSDLPKHRGPSPIEQTILDGDPTTAVSLIKLVEDMDAGPVYAKAKLDVDPKISKSELTERLIQTGTELLRKTLPQILSGELKPQPQDDKQATYTSLIHKQDGLLDWAKPAQTLVRQLRAYQGWPGSFCDIFSVRITILSASVDTRQGKPGEHYIYDDGALGVYCSEDSLKLERVRPAGKNTMDSRDFVRGYKRK